MFKIFGRKKKKKDEAEKHKVINSTTGPVDASDPRDGNNKNGKQNNNSKKAGKNDMMKAAMSGVMSGGGDIKEMLKSIDTSGMSIKEKMGLKMLQRMSRKKQEEVMRQAMNPQELHKNKDQVLKQIDEMVKTGQIDKGRAEAVKAQMGLR